MPVDIFLVRHGEAAASWGQSPDPGLSKLGREQAADAAQVLLPELDSDSLLISSPLLRARETAEPLASALGFPVREDSAFSEIPAPVPLPRRQDWLRGFMQQQWQEQPGDLHRWRAAAYDGLLALDAPAVVFTHFLVINAVVGLVLNRPETLCFWPDNGSITRLHNNGDNLELRFLGEQMPTHVN